ncbi:MAG TPA: TetR/AcrR family transcriptional regulator [Stenotrophomonas sp.]|nr:TetR/AcrR family transcriptional regulator [Stenotrophomonas sp.]
MPTAPAPTSRQTRDRRVHEAVHALLAEQGMRLSMEAVAARAGCSKQTLYAHYGCKENLLRTVMRDQVALTTDTLEHDGTDLRSSLLAFAEQHLEQLNRPHVIQTCRLIDAESHRFPEQARQIYNDGVAALQDQLAQWLGRASARGQLRHDDPHAMAELLLGMIVGLDFERQRFHTQHRSDAPSRRRWAEHSIDSFLRAFAP